MTKLINLNSKFKNTELTYDDLESIRHFISLINEDAGNGLFGIRIYEETVNLINKINKVLKPYNWNTTVRINKILEDD